ncbi:5344_t:CDS:2, partial [Ambispora leptoticha]
QDEHVDAEDLYAKEHLNVFIGHVGAGRSMMGGNLFVIFNGNGGSKIYGKEERAKVGGASQANILVL